jgi:SAM-dependent MidA family methyltransferase
MAEQTPLEIEIRRRIKAAGPMPLSEYMALCLSDPKYGYYTTHDPLGARGDFITAPEISQMFGELIGLWMAATWKKMGAPENVRFIELGPGRGTLMKDALRALNVMPGFREAIVVHLVEINPVLRTQQERTLQGPATPIFWHDTLEDVPPGPGIVIANEFFDALPVCQAIRTARGWHERCVHIDAEDQLAFTHAADPIPKFESILPKAVRDAPVDSIFEWRDERAAMGLGRRIADNGGAALVIDYGHAETDVGDTLQAVGRHAFADPLMTPGDIDLTAHVDFQALKRAVEAMGPAGYGPVDQGEFLRRLGIETRAANLRARALPAAAAQVDEALSRLTGYGRSQMGGLFKAVAFAPRALGVPAAFD